MDGDGDDDHHDDDDDDSDDIGDKSVNIKGQTGTLCTDWRNKIGPKGRHGDDDDSFRQ